MEKLDERWVDIKNGQGVTPIAEHMTIDYHDKRHGDFRGTNKALKSEMHNAKIFDSAIQGKGWGNRFEKMQYLRNLQDHKYSHQFFLEGHRANSEKLLKPFPEVIYDYINNTSFDAHAFKYKEYYIIAIHIGVWAILSDLFYRMLAHSEICPGIGNARGEQSASSIGDYYSDASNLLLNTPLKGFRQKFPRDPTRQLYAYHLVGRAMDFVFEHELAHILFGHVDYSPDHLQIDCVSEYQSSELVDQIKFDLQTLEMNADTMGLLSCATRAVNAIQDVSAVNPPFRGFYRDKYQVLSDLAFAVFNVIRVFGDRDYQDTRLGKSTHPDPRVRQVILLSFLEQILQSQQVVKIDRDKLHSRLIGVMVQSERAYKLITGKQHNTDVYGPEYFSNHPLNSALPNNWKKNIRKKLLKYTYVPLPT